VANSQKFEVINILGMGYFFILRALSNGKYMICLFRFKFLLITCSMKQRKKISEKTERRLGIALSYLSMLIGLIVLLVYTPFKLRTLGGSPEEADIQFGLNSFVDSITSWITVLSTSMAVSYIRFVTIRQKEKGEEGVRETNAVYSLFYIFCFVLAVLVGFGLYFLFRFDAIPLNGYSAEQKAIILDLLLLSLVSVCVSLIFTIFNNFLNFHQKYIYIRLVSIFISLCTPLVSFPFLKEGCNVQTLVIITILVNVFAQLCNAFVAIFLEKQKFSFKFDKGTKLFVRNIIFFSFFLIFNTVVDQIDMRIDKTILGFMAPPAETGGASQVTIYELGQTFVSYLDTASIAVASVFVPEVNRLVVSEDWEGLHRLFLKVSRFQMIIVFTIVGGFWCCGQSFVIAWLGDTKKDVYYVAAVLLTLAVIPFSESISVEAQRAMNKHKFRGLVYFVAALVNVGLSILFVYLMPIQQAIFACLIGTIVTYIPSKWIIMNWYNRKKIGLPMKQYWIMLFSFTLATGVAAGFSFLTYLALPDLSGWKWNNFLVRGGLFLLYQTAAMLILNIHQIKSFLWRHLQSRNSGTR
jgi:O-antigen/teichoic acid export membrane protein